MRTEVDDTTVARGAGTAGAVYASAPLTGDATAEDRATITRRTSVYVYEAPVRLWHWVNAAAIMTLCVTGYLIG